MGWWVTRSGSILGDAVANYVEELSGMGVAISNPSELSGEVRERLDALYVEGIGRPPTESELRDLLAFIE